MEPTKGTANPTGVNLDFNDTREPVLTGLRSRELCTMLLGRTHDDDDGLLHDILEFQRIERERREILGTCHRGLASSPGNLKRRFVDDYWTNRNPPTRPVTDDTTIQGFVKREKELLRARPQNMPGIRLKLSQNAMDMSHMFCLRTPTTSLTYVLKGESDLQQPRASHN
ncbi:hypothetical protein HPB52_012321 [Rhipicephalus sanguineus]|uniref:Uncharacterized protein n=1 Tax=Rhipicephalus sanguineus TaxID=34632 RepID=A0A9D4SUF1_RHISA|nr:hypothetical protein HPB52_012321 [Rhipicephalus sanguineus]